MLCYYRAKTIGVFEKIRIRHMDWQATREYSFFNIFVILEELWNAFRNWANVYNSSYKFWIGHWPNVNLCHPDDAEVRSIFVVSSIVINYIQLLK